MIWDVIGKDRVVVRVPTEQSVIEFFDELLRRYPAMRTPSKYILSSLVEREDEAAVYISADWESDELNWEYCDYSWYAKHSPYCDSVFYDWAVTPADLGEIYTEDSIDINSLFGEVMS